MGSTEASDSIVFLYQLSNLLPTAVPLTSVVAQNRALLRRCSDLVGEAFVLDNVNASEVPIDDSPRKSTAFKVSIFSEVFMPPLCDRPDSYKRAVALVTAVSDRQKHCQSAMCTKLPAQLTGCTRSAEEK